MCPVCREIYEQKTSFFPIMENPPEGATLTFVPNDISIDNEVPLERAWRVEFKKIHFIPIYSPNFAHIACQKYPKIAQYTPLFLTDFANFECLRHSKFAQSIISIFPTKIYQLLTFHDIPSQKYRFFFHFFTSFFALIFSHYIEFPINYISLDRY